jgi:CRP-like cAMP-binding protein
MRKDWSMPEGSFFGEGYLAGQALRMATACTIETSTFIRVEKAAMLHRHHHEPDFAERFLACVLSRNIRPGSCC